MTKIYINKNCTTNYLRYINFAYNVYTIPIHTCSPVAHCNTWVVHHLAPLKTGANVCKANVCPPCHQLPDDTGPRPIHLRTKLAITHMVDGVPADISCSCRSMQEARRIIDVRLKDLLYPVTRTCRNGLVYRCSKNQRVFLNFARSTAVRDLLCSIQATS